jgi:hypothetical protein
LAKHVGQVEDGCQPLILLSDQVCVCPHAKEGLNAQCILVDNLDSINGESELVSYDAAPSTRAALQ